MSVLLLGALLTGCLESLLYRLAGYERGPAAPVQARQNVHVPHPDRWLYPAGPVVALLGVALAMIVVPLGPGFIGSDLGIGVFYFIVVVDFVVLGIAVGGWGANTANAVEACYRIVAQLIAYVVPLGLALMGPIMMARSLSTMRIVEAQTELWFVVLQPLGFALYVVTGLMQTYRPPFVEPFARTIGYGIVSTYGGWKALLWRLALSGVLLVVAAMGSVLFLGGWRGPWLPGPLWMLGKTYALMAFMVWLGTRVRPLSTAQTLALAWKVLIPVGLVNVLVVGALILLGMGPS
jgi:NADH-quinone oxidoreductase subunit H